MFETVVPEAVGQRRSQRLRYEILPLSIALHVIVVAAAIAATVWQIDFPSDSPRLTALYSLEAPPPPPPPPPPAAAQKVTVKVVPVKLPDNVAPTIIPDQVPVLETVTTQTVDGVEGGVDGGIMEGVVGGETEGVQGGIIGGVDGGTPGGIVDQPPPPRDGPVIIERDKSLPMFALSQVYPTYPREAMIRNWEDEMVVRYVIGKNGRVREVSIISKPQHDIFEDAALRAIRNWRFKPLIQDGEAKEVIHEKTVYFRLDHG
ncbi:MAG TPA: energy transducer TonB [Thermoanaerobaculia bacterium]|nr:energy transducer TonB [Thermoanaerobaculia bacterium]